MQKTVLVSGLLCVSLIGAVTRASAADSQARQMECAQLSGLKLPDVKITEATAVAAAAQGAVRVPHCRVNGVIGTEIRFSLLLPDMWNGKFMMGGGGGYVGSVQNQAIASVNLGYATVGTDTGHQGIATDASWALDSPERLVNFGTLGVHRTAEVAKAIVRSYYGSEASHSYFSGCSNGGRQALMEAQRFPDDFDGIVAGAPAYDFVGLAAQFIKDTQAVFPDAHSTTPLFPPETLKSVESQILATCDAADGVNDGVIDDPRSCKIDVASLTGLTPVQQTALKKVYGETRGASAAIFPGQPVGGEGDMAGWPMWITGGATPVTPQGPSLRYAFGTQFFKYFVFADPKWDYTHYDISQARRDARLAAAALSATNPDLSLFKSKGHKLILWHGWADPALTPFATVDYYDRVRERDPNAQEFVRLFMLPGVLHCTGGAGPAPDPAVWVTALEDWVEHGKAPDRLIATKTVSGTTRTRPVCTYPQHAVYSGSGSTDDEKNFVCR